MILHLLLAVLAAPQPFETYLLDEAGRDIPAAWGSFQVVDDQAWLSSDSPPKPSPQRYLKTPARADEPVPAALARVRALLPPLPEGRCFVLELRDNSWIAHEAIAPAVLGTADVISANLVQREASEADDVQLLVGLTPAGAARLAKVPARTRMALVIDGRLDSIPVIPAPITGGEIVFGVGHGPGRPERARQLAAVLSGTNPAALTLPSERPWATVDEPGLFRVSMPEPGPGKHRKASYTASVSGLDFHLSWARKHGKHSLEDAESEVIAVSEKNRRVAVREGPIELQGHPGRSIRIGYDKSDVAIAIRLYEIGDRVYTLSIVGTQEGVKSPLAARFFDSFSVP